MSGCFAARVARGETQCRSPRNLNLNSCPGDFPSICYFVKIGLGTRKSLACPMLLNVVESASIFFRSIQVLTSFSNLTHQSLCQPSIDNFTSIFLRFNLSDARSIVHFSAILHRLIWLRTWWAVLNVFINPPTRKAGLPDSLRHYASESMRIARS